ncbi:hypothetical protein JY651_48270 [Pyxidicoccus parkwayensis]|uniref:Lipoprotein n=1 Tax=Pyxidicoccus parkwayensis TaxID=2813578 RepID=A0ABX7NV60_9BACT|nr:hypothetical protein [Pyxidicoccus parkwaysis]QSQ22811.1 hypothetical protein JY651_48270 [Pyxidicoccus parkwaysis]
MKTLRLALACLFALGATACNDTLTSDSVVEETGTTTAEAAVTRLYASVGNNELSIETLGTFETRNGERVLVIHGTANRYLENVFSFVPDDIFGETSIISERRFEVVLREGHELNTVLSGLPLFIAIDTFTGAPHRYFARIVIAPRFYDFVGSSGIWIDEAVNPVYVVQGNSNLLYRGRASVSGYADWLSVTAPDGIPSVYGRPNYRLDWTYEKVYQAIDPHTQALTFTSGGDDGPTMTKTARLVARVTELAVTDGDPYEVWPSQECPATVYNCIHSKPTGTTDFSSCGTYREVSRCMYVTSTCELVPPPPSSLTAIDASSLAPAVTAWNSTSSSTDWHHISTTEAYSAFSCPAWATTIQTLMANFNATRQDLPLAEYGTFTDRAGLSQSTFFSGSNSALLAAIDSFAGGGTIQAWIAEEEVACHNCHDNKDYAVLFYPGSGKVVVLQGNHGYDW